MVQRFLGELELFVLGAAARLGDDAYGASIRREIVLRTGRDVAIGSIYATLGNMHDKGFVSFELGNPQPVQGGRARRMIRLTATGKRALHDSLRALHRLSSGLAFGTDP
jgi:DNA-binding PadR family transcriptional regulator